MEIDRCWMEIGLVVLLYISSSKTYNEEDERTETGN